MAAKAEKKLRFALDCSLGRLAKWLRILGFDAVYVSGAPDESFFTRAGNDRVLLTRSRKIQKANPGFPLFFIRSNDAWEQLKQVVEEVEIEISDLGPFSRCIYCNIPVVAAAREQVAGLVPDYVHETRETFKKCSECGRIYWPGTHTAGILSAIRKLFDSSETPPP